MKLFAVLLLGWSLVPSSEAQLIERPEVQTFRIYINQLLDQKKESLVTAKQSLPGVSFYLSPRSDLIRIVVEIKERDGTTVRMPTFSLITTAFSNDHAESYAKEIIQGIDVAYETLADFSRQGKIKLCTEDQIVFKGSPEERAVAKKVSEALFKTSVRYAAEIRERNSAFTSSSSELYENNGKKYVLITARVVNDYFETDDFPIITYPIEKLDEAMLKTIGEDAFEHILSYFPAAAHPAEQVGNDFLVKNLAPRFRGAFSGVFSQNYLLCREWWGGRVV